jgi:hypothetical protein
MDCPHCGHWPCRVTCPTLMVDETLRRLREQEPAAVPHGFDDGAVYGYQCQGDAGDA